MYRLSLRAFFISCNVSKQTATLTLCLPAVIIQLSHEAINSISCVREKLWERGHAIFSWWFFWTHVVHTESKPKYSGDHSCMSLVSCAKTMPLLSIVWSSSHCLSGCHLSILSLLSSVQSSSANKANGMEGGLDLWQFTDMTSLGSKKGAVIMGRVRSKVKPLARGRY